MNRPRYDLNATWDDPFERRADRRSSPRVRTEFRSELSVRAEHARGRFVGPALVQNLSLTSLCTITKHALQPGQRVELRFATDALDVDDVLAEEFRAECRVLRVEPMDGRRNIVVLALPKSLTDDMEFARFFRQIETPSRPALAF